MDTVLVAEPNQNQRVLYRMELEDEGYRVLTAGDEKEARQAAEQELLDVAVLDLHIWDRKQGVVFEEVKNASPSLPVIIYTASTVSLEASRTYPAEAYLIKNSDLGPLKQAICQVLSQNTRGKERQSSLHL